jgi:hypothetical protein
LPEQRSKNRNEKTIESGGNKNKNEKSFKKVPTGVKKPEIPVKNSDVSEPDAVPSKTYSVIISNKKKNEKASTIGGIASGQDPTECGSFFNPGDNRTLRSVYKEDVTSGSVSSMSFNPVSWMCTACPRSHSVFEGTVILVGSISLLARVGVHGYSSACINAKRRLTGAIKGVVVIPFIPPPPIRRLQ